MLKHFVLILLLTFITGFAAGVYGFFVTRGETENNTPNTSTTEREGFDVYVTTYGGCERIGCASLHLRDDGSYVYLAPNSAQEYTRQEDSITEKQREELTELIARTPYVRVGDTPFTGTCPTSYDGLAYRFDIRHKGERYSYDSCEHALDEVPLILELMKYLGIMEATYHDR